MRKILILFTTLLLFNVTFSLELKRASTSNTVAEREPVELTDSFKVGERAYLFTEFEDIGNEQTINHLWFFVKSDGSMEKVLEVPLVIKGPRWRTWSYKTMNKPGTWKIMVVSQTGETLFEKNIEVLQ